MLWTGPTSAEGSGQPWYLSADNCTHWGTQKGIPERSFDKASKPPDLMLPELKIVECSWENIGLEISRKVWGSQPALTGFVSLPFNLFASLVWRSSLCFGGYEAALLWSRGRWESQGDNECGSIWPMPSPSLRIAREGRDKKAATLKTLGLSLVCHGSRSKILPHSSFWWSGGGPLVRRWFPLLTAS